SAWPTLWIFLPAVVGGGAVLFFAFGAAPGEKSRRIGAQHGVVALACGATIWGMFHYGIFISDQQGRGILFDRPRMPLAWVVGIVAILAACIAGIALAWTMQHTWAREPEKLRNQLTKWLAWILRIILGIIALGIIDGLAWWLARGDLSGQGKAGAGIAVTAAV